MNILMVVVIFVSAVTFFITVKMSQVASTLFAHNSFNVIEGSEYAVKYSNIETNGIYKGAENISTLVAEGNFGYGENAALDGEALYTNEYKLTGIGLETSSVVRINLKTGEKTVIFEDACLMGRCASGELVITDGFVSETNKSETNALCLLYSLSCNNKDGKNTSVFFYDTQKGKAVFSTENKAKNDKTFRIAYLDKTLQEVRG